MPPADGRCRVKFAAPYQPRRRVGSVHRADDAHRVVLDLERNTDAGWLSMDEDVSDVIPYPGAVPLTVLVECRPGTWRLRYDVRAVAQGQTATRSDASDELSVTSAQDCQVPR